MTMYRWVRKDLSIALLALSALFITTSTNELAVNGVADQATLSSSSYVVESTLSSLRDTYGRLPLSFEENRGQTDNQVKFLTRGSGYHLLLTSSEMVLIFSRPAAITATSRNTAVDVEHTLTLRIAFSGENPALALVGIDELPGKVNYFRGADPEAWRTNIPTYRRIEYSDVYPGIDLAVYGHEGQLEYDVTLTPGADIDTVRLTFEGTDHLTLGPQGDLIIDMPDGKLAFSAPVFYQQTNGVREIITGGYTLHNQNQVGFYVTHYDATRPLIIDPTLIYSTYLGGQLADVGLAITADADGNAYITGETRSLDFPTEPNAFQDSFQGDVEDTFVVRLDPTGSTRLYATYLGGNATVSGWGIAVDADGNAYVTGRAGNINVGNTDFTFPTTPGAHQTNYGGNTDAFVAKLNPSGSDLVYSTLLGNGGGDAGNDIVVDDDGSAYITGVTSSHELATPGAAQDALQGDRDAFVAKFNSIGSELMYFTYLGGSGDDEGHGIAIDDNRHAYVTGETDSNDLSVTKICGGRVDHAANSNAWPSARAGTGAEVS